MESDFLSPVTRRASSSVWALSSLAEKNNKVHPSFFFACIGEYLKERLKGSDWEKVIVCSSRPIGYHFFKPLLKGLGLQVVFAGNHPLGRRERCVEWVKIGLKRIRVLFRFLATKVLLMRIGRLSDESADVWFYTQFSRTWLEQDEFRYDRFYRRLPSVLGQRSGRRVGYLVNVSGTHFVRKIRDVSTDIDQLRSMSALAGVPYTVLETYMKVGDALRLLLSPAYCIIFGRLLKSRYREVFEFRGMDLSHVMRSEIFSSMITVPLNLLYITAIRRFVEECRVPELIHPFFEYSWGKAILYGAADAEVDCRNVAIQHGSFASNLLLAINDPQDFLGPEEGGNGIQLPLASAYYIDGSIIKQCLSESGYPEDRLFSLGAPRFDNLRMTVEGKVNCEIAEIVASARRESKQIMLLVPVPHDMHQFAEFVDAAIGDLDPERYLLIWKFPPNVSKGEREEFVVRSPFFVKGHALVAEAPIYQLMELSDTVVTTLSTAGLEAMAMDKNVVCVTLPGGLNLSPLIDGVNLVPIICDPLELATVMKERDMPPPQEEDFVERQITGLDGNAAERIADHMNHVFLDSVSGGITTGSDYWKEM
jgi:hypothetical protein